MLSNILYCLSTAHILCVICVRSCKSVWTEFHFVTCL